MLEKYILKISAIISGISGFIILAGVVIPIAGYESFANRKYPTLLNPLVEDSTQFAALGAIDDTKASNWFTGAGMEIFKAPSVSYFTLSIPKLDIEKATVSLGDEDLTKSLVQYPGTALPGKKGNTVVFGHSILPIFYNPKNYMAIFSTIHTLKPGDEILIGYDGVSYKYEVEEMEEVLPTQLEVLDQDMADSVISLITCTPPGDPRKPKRLVVKARLVPFTEANANTWH